jgi:hypothetical protein
MRLAAINSINALGAPESRGKRPFPSRTMHLIDIENLSATALPSPTQVRELQRAYALRIGFGAMDQTVVACNHLAMANVGAGWIGARYLVRSGEDGADLALLDVITLENLITRFSHVTIASGDGIFAWPASMLAGSGCAVTVNGQPSRRTVAPPRTRRTARDLHRYARGDSHGVLGPVGCISVISMIRDPELAISFQL